MRKDNQSVGVEKVKETRVGYQTVDALADMLKEYITGHTVNKRYIGRLDYLDTYRSCLEFLRR
jgi:hypothetical protein